MFDENSFHIFVPIELIDSFTVEKEGMYLSFRSFVPLLGVFRSLVPGL